MRFAVGLLLLATIVTADEAPLPDIVDLAGRLEATQLLSALESMGLTETLEGEGPFTVFAPTNKAIESLPKEITDAIEEDPSVLVQILLYHVVGGYVMASDVTDNALVSSLADGGLKIRANIFMNDMEQVITVAGSRVKLVDQMASNGVIHVIDRVMIPPVGTLVDAVSDNEKLSTLLSLVASAGLVDALEVMEDAPLTIFAPDNDAFDMATDLDPSDIATVARVLQYHVTAGAGYSAGLSNGQQLQPLDGAPLFVSKVNGKVYINDAMVVNADETATNGVIHVLDRALSPPEGDIVDLAIAAGFSSLVEAVSAADLVSVLQGGPYTVFAPTNDAFEKANINMDDKATLAKVLKYHVVPAVAYSFSLYDGQRIDTVQGQGIDVSLGESVMLNGIANVIDVDVQAYNGIIHVIDHVLMPVGDLPPIGSASGLVGSLALTLLSAICRML